jgi:hypothetical protein
MKLSTTGLPSIKSVHDESQSNSQNCTRTNFWTPANDFWFTVVLKVTTFWKESSQEKKHGSIIISQRVNARVWNGHILIHPPRKGSNASNCRKAYADSFLGLTGATAGTLSREGFNSEQCLQQ